MDMTKHVDVLIATPGTNFDYRYIRSLMLTVDELNSRGLTYQWLCGYSSMVNVAREITIAGDSRVDYSENGPLRGSVTYNKILLIDSDIVWSSEDFFKLYDADVDVISGIYAVQGVDVFQTNLYDSSLKPVVPTDEHMFTVDYVGLGFVAVRSGVFERMQRPWFNFLNVDIQDVAGNKLAKSISEDISWCWKLRELEIPVYVDPTVKVGHIKPMVLTP